MSDVYQELRTHFEGVDTAEVNTGKGSQGIKRGKKMFAMFYKGDLLVQLPKERVVEVVDSGEALPFDPGTGKTSKDRVLIPAQKKDTWIAFCEESLENAIKLAKG